MQKKDNSTVKEKSGEQDITKAADNNKTHRNDNAKIQKKSNYNQLIKIETKQRKQKNAFLKLRAVISNFSSLEINEFEIKPKYLLSAAILIIFTLILTYLIQTGNIPIFNSDTSSNKLFQIEFLNNNNVFQKQDSSKFSECKDLNLNLQESDSATLQNHTKCKDYSNIYREIDKHRQKIDTLQEQDRQTTDQKSQNPSQQPNTPEAGSPNDQPYWAYPNEILPCDRSGNDLLVLVNKKFQLPTSYSPNDLVPISNAGIRTTKSGLYVRNIMITDLQNMTTEIKNQGIDIAVLSAYRSYQTQQSTYNYWVNYNGGNTDAADKVSARPGHSQHQLGTAVDFTSSEIGDALGTQFENTQASRWLTQNAWKYGFALSFPKGWEHETGFNYEPWHYRYIGRENAQTWHNSGQILELWLRSVN
jgi:D-alanyl-D-alanine carboxypeptidase